MLKRRAVDTEQIYLIKTIRQDMDSGQLLAQEGWFLLVDVFRVLSPGDPGPYKLAFKQIQKIVNKGQDPFDVMGHKKVGGRVFVLMERFAPWYLGNPLFRLRKLPAEYPFESFIRLTKGSFRLSEVCKGYEDRLPFSYNSIKRLVDQTPQSRKNMGVYKFDKTYILEMPAFARWFGNQLI